MIGATAGADRPALCERGEVQRRLAR